MNIPPWLGRHRDLVIAGAVTVLLVFDAVRWDFVEPSKSVPAALLAAVPLALRRRLALVSFVLCGTGFALILVLTGEDDSTTVALIAVYLLTLYSAGRYTRRLEASITACLVLLGAVAFAFSDRNPVTAGGLAFSLAFIGVPWAAGLVVRLRTERESALRAANAQLEAEQEERAHAAVVAERSRIARELHDVVSHAISVTVLQARGGRRMLGVDESEVRKALNAIEHVNGQALGDMRRLLFLLRDVDDEPSHHPSPSLARLDALVAHVRDTGLPVDLSVTGSIEQIPPGVDLSAYRIVQEALTNSLKHAGPSAHARVEIICGAAGLNVAISDDGHAGDPTSGRGHGLIGIRERVAVVGGDLEAGPGEHGGFVVRAKLPYAVEV